MRFGAPLKPKPNAAVLVAKCRPHSHSTQDIRVGGTLRTSPGARLRAPRTPARTRTFSPLDVVPAVQDLLQQGHQSEGADEDEKQSSVPQQIPVRRGIRVAHPGGRSCAAGRGGRGAPSGPRNHARGSGGPGPRGAHDLPGASWRDQTDGDFSGQSFRWRGQRRGHPSVAGAGAKRRAGLAAGARRRLQVLPPDGFTPRRQRPASADFPAEGQRPGAPNPGQPLPPRWRPMGSRARAAFRQCAQERRAPPPPVALGIVVAQRSALPQRIIRSPRPTAREREGWPSILHLGGGRQNTRTVWLMTGGWWRGGGWSAERRV